MKDMFIFLIFGLLIFFGVSSCNTSEWYQQQKRDDKAQELREKTPHVIREVDGCKVYAFRSNTAWHFFTRCQDSNTTTESRFEECHGSGKQRTCSQKSETMETTR